MKQSFFRTLSWLHTWAGLLVCWVLMLMFFAGTLSYFRHEITLWTKPELHQGAIQSYQAEALSKQLDLGQNYLETNANTQAQRWIINLPTDRSPLLSYAWQLVPEKGQRRGKIIEQTALADGTGVIENVRQTRGGDFFYRLHYELNYLPGITARYIVGVCTMFMLIALISGIVIHKRIFKDLFSFRPGKGARSWLDGHTVSSVIALPFHLMITYTGLVTLMLVYIPWTVDTAYPNERQTFLTELNPARQIGEASGIAANLIPLSQYLPQVEAHWGNAPIQQVVVAFPKDQNSQVIFYQDTGNTVTDAQTMLIFSGTTGELKFASQAETSSAAVVHDTIMSLHTARFSAPLLRALYFVCGLLGCAMVASGPLMWAVRLRQQQQNAIAKGEKPTRGLRLVEGLNFMFIVGLPLGAAAFFYTNRLLAVGFTERAAWEVHSFFIVLIVMGIWAVIGRSRWHWRLALSITGLLYCALPLVNGFTSNSHIFDNIRTEQWGLVGFDMVAVIFGTMLLFVSSRIKPNHQSHNALLGNSASKRVAHYNGAISEAQNASPTALKEVKS
ncbi:PepSY domain-containing protein [Shewanella sp. A25]|nr:PepSY domain-containing protein [Shewanella shenzhenensis]